MKGLVVNLGYIWTENYEQKALKHSFKLEFRSSYPKLIDIYTRWKSQISQNLVENNQKELAAFYGLFAILRDTSYIVACPKK